MTNPDMRKHPPCPLCRCALAAQPEPDKTWLFGFCDGLELVRCCDCSLIYLRSDGAGSAHARDDDYIRTRILETYNDPPPEQTALFRRRLELVGKQVRGRRVLDIGCGNGAFLSTAKALGWQARGVDISETPRDLLAPLGIHVYVADAVEFLGVHAESFDLIHMNHSLEYMPAAAEVVQAARRALAPGGLLYLEVPNEFDNLVYRTLEIIGRKRRRGSLFGRSTARTLPSRHRYFFNKKSLGRLALIAGFATFKVEAGRREPFEFKLADAADAMAALLGAGSFLTLMANAPADAVPLGTPGPRLAAHPERVHAREAPQPARGGSRRLCRSAL